MNLARAAPKRPAMPPLSTPWQVFATFAAASLVGFGGMLPHLHRMVVDRRRWLTDSDFAALWTLALTLPGPAICNLAVIIGHRRSGMAGACTALLGTIVLPSVLVVVLGAVYARYGATAALHGALRGMSAAAAGMMAAMALRLALGSRRALSWLLIAVVVVAIGVLRLPFLAVIGVLGPLSIAYHWRRAP